MKKIIKNLSVCFLLLYIIFFFYSCMSGSDYIVKTMNYYSAEKYDKAITAGKRATAINADKPEGWYWLALSLLAKGQVTEAYNAFYYVTTLDTGIHALVAYKNLCIIDYHNSDYESYQLNYEKAEAFYNKHKSDTAFAKPAEIMSAIYYYLGYISYRNADYGSAIKAFDKIPEFDAAAYDTYPCWVNHVCYTHRGWCYIYEQRYNDALTDFQSAIKIDTARNKLFSDYRGKGWAEYYSGDYSNAIKDFDRAINDYSFPADYDFAVSTVYQGKAFSYLALKDKETALSMIDKIKTIDSYYNTNDDYAKIYYALGEKEKAWKYRGGSGSIGADVFFIDNRKTIGVKIMKIETDGPAMKAGLQKGDIITMIDSKKIDSDSSYAAASHALIPGNIATIMINREGSQKSYSLKIESAEKEMESDPLISKIIATKSNEKK